MPVLAHDMQMIADSHDNYNTKLNNFSLVFRIISIETFCQPDGLNTGNCIDIEDHG